MCVPAEQKGAQLASLSCSVISTLSAVLMMNQVNISGVLREPQQRGGGGRSGGNTVEMHLRAEVAVAKRLPIEGPWEAGTKAVAARRYSDTVSCWHWELHKQ